MARLPMTSRGGAAATGPSRLARLFSLERSPVLYLLPTVVFLAAFLAYPILEVLRQSFFHNVPIRPWEEQGFVGLRNYGELIGSDAFRRSLGITALWTTLSVSGKLLIGLGAALLLQHPFRGRRIYLTLLMIPWVTPIVVAAVVWRWVLNSQYGQLNALLELVGIPGVAWLGATNTAFLATVAVDMWVGIPFVALVLMAGLQAIPDQFYEAARIDGAGSWTIFRHVTMPLLRHVFVVVALLSSVWTFNSFEVIYPMTRGGPAGATTTLVIQTYATAFASFDFGRAAALAVTIFVILTTVALLYWRALRER